MTLCLKSACFSRAEIGDICLAIKSPWSKLSHYKILDKYPPSMEGEIRSIQKAITTELYDFMTCNYTYSKLWSMVERFNVEIVAFAENLVIRLPNHPNYVLKSSPDGLLDEMIKFNKSMPFGRSYGATNNEGGVSPCFFKLAERVAFSIRLRHVIKKHRLNMIKVPKKALVSFPQQLVPFGSLPLHHKRVFVVSKRYEVDLTAPMMLDEVEQIEFARQLKVFFLKAKGILDTHAANFCFKGKKILFFDTEKFHLDPFCRVCVSTPLKEARIGLENMRRYFSCLPEEVGGNLVSLCLKEIQGIKRQEKAILITRICVSIFLVAYAYVTFQSISSMIAPQSLGEDSTIII